MLMNPPRDSSDQTCTLLYDHVREGEGPDPWLISRLPSMHCERLKPSRDLLIET